MLKLDPEDAESDVDDSHEKSINSTAFGESTSLAKSQKKIQNEESTVVPSLNINNIQFLTVSGAESVSSCH